MHKVLLTLQLNTDIAAHLLEELQVEGKKKNKLLAAKKRR